MHDIFHKVNSGWVSGVEGQPWCCQVRLGVHIVCMAADIPTASITLQGNLEKRLVPRLTGWPQNRCVAQRPCAGAATSAWL